MEKALGKVLCNTLLSPKSVLAVIFFTAIIYVLNTADRRYAKAGGQITLLSATVPETDTIGQPTFGESETKAEQYNKWQTVRMRVTAYCPCRKCCGKYSDGKTACGYKIHPGDVFISADKKYPFGTEMIITGYNNGKPVKVLDRGSAIHGNRIDVFFNSHQEARKWGVKYLNVKIHRRQQDWGKTSNSVEKIEYNRGN